jgi:outer membrane protein TolC
MKRFGISQEWLSGDKRDARRAAAEAAVGKESVQERIAAADARLQTALAYVEAFYVGEALQLTTSMEHHAHEQLETARARLASGGGSSEEVLRLGAARGMAEDESAELRQQQSAASVALQRWTGTRADELVEPAGLVVPSEDGYVDADPTVVALRREIDVARTAAAATSSNRHPNWTWEVAYEQRSGYSDMVSFGVTIPLPVAPESRQDRDTASKLALVDKAEADLTEAMRAARGEYLALVGDVQRLQERLERVRSGVLVPAQQRIAAVTAAYRSNQASLTTLFDARHGEVDVQRKLLGVRRELAKRQAQLAYRPIRMGGMP